MIAKTKSRTTSTKNRFSAKSRTHFVAVKIWQFTRAEGWEPAEDSHPMAEFPDPERGIGRRIEYTGEMARCLSANGFDESGQATGIGCGGVVLHAATGPRATTAYFGWGLLMKQPTRILFPEHPDVVKFLKENPGSTRSRRFYPVRPSS